MLRKLLSKRWVQVIGVIVILLAFLIIRSNIANRGPFYETETVKKRDLKQTVEITGQVKPDTRLDLAFRASGRLIRTYSLVGKSVKKNDLIAELDARDLAYAVQRASASLASASAALQSRIIGDTPEAIAIARAGVDQAKAAYTKSISDLSAMRITVEQDFIAATIAIDTAQKNLTNQTTNLEQNVQNNYDSLRTTLLNAIGPMQNSLNDGDAIIGVDNSAANDNYEGALGVLDQFSLNFARNTYLSAKMQKQEAEARVRGLSTRTSFSDIRDTARFVKDALGTIQQYLDAVDRTLIATPITIGISATDHAAKRATISADRASISAQIGTVLTGIQSGQTSEITRESTLVQLQNNVSTAESNLKIADANRVSRVKTAESAVASAKASIASAEAQLASKLVPPRSVDLASLRANVYQARVAYDQARSQLDDARIIAPADGVISEIIPSIGEMVMANAKAVGLVMQGQSAVEATIPEGDVAKVVIGQSAIITFDAFGDSRRFSGRVVLVHPDETKIQDAVYYKADIAIDKNESAIKPGMTANITIATNEAKSVISVPSRAIREKNGKRFVEILGDNKKEDKEIQMGLRSDDGRVEVISGLNENQIVIVSELTAAEFKTRKAEKEKI